MTKGRRECLIMEGDNAVQTHGLSYDKTQHRARAREGASRIVQRVQVPPFDGETNQSMPYPPGFFVCQFHKSRHIVVRSFFARNPSSFSASVGSAVKSGTSPRLVIGSNDRRR